MMMFAQPFGRGVRRAREDAVETPFAHVNKRVKRTLADELCKLRLQPVMQPAQRSPEPVWYDQVSSPDTDQDEPMMDDVDMMGDDEEEEELQLVPYEKPTSQSYTLAAPSPSYHAAIKTAFVEEIPPATSTAIVLYRPPRNVDWKTAPESDASCSEDEDDASYQMMDIDDDL